MFTFTHGYRKAACALAVTALTLTAAERQPAASSVLVPLASNPPILAGDVFHYSTKSTTTITTTGLKPIVESFSETFSIAASAGATFDGRKGLTKLTYVYGVGSASTTVYAYVGFEPSGALMRELLYGSTESSSAFGASQSSVSTYPAGAIEAYYPEAAGQRWTPAATFTTVSQEAEPGGTSKTTRTDYLDGSYVSDSSSVTGATKVAVTQVLASNGSGKTTTSATGDNNGSVTYALPVAKSGKNYIPETAEGANPLPAKPTPAKTYDVPDWFPGHAAPAHPLAVSEITDKGIVTTPAACGAFKGVKAYELESTSRTLDPVDGTYTTLVGYEYDVPGRGNVCSLSTEAGDDYSNSPPTATGALTGTTRTVSVTVLTSESGPKPLAGYPAIAQPHPLSRPLAARIQRMGLIP
jgi:hypothetical protein